MSRLPSNVKVNLTSVDPVTEALTDALMAYEDYCQPFRRGEEDRNWYRPAARKRAAFVADHLRDAGITVQFPEPRYYATPVDRHRPSGAWLVYRRGTAGYLASFDPGVPQGAEQVAKDFADRLNREVTP